MLLRMVETCLFLYLCISIYQVLVLNLINFERTTIFAFPIMVLFDKGQFQKDKSLFVDVLSIMHLMSTSIFIFYLDNIVLSLITIFTVSFYFRNKGSLAHTLFNALNLLAIFLVIYLT